jgi:hypothetical protein
MEKISFTSEEIAKIREVYARHADATPLALYVLNRQGKLVDGLWRKINVWLGRTEAP